MLRDDASLIDIYNRIKQILTFAEGLTAEALAKDKIRLGAILYGFIVIGEATKRLSPQFRAEHPEIPWKDMAGTRDVLAHQYDKVDVIRLRRSIEVSLPEALEKITLLLPEGYVER
ncbi:MAG: HepT-like ribonuclease domain-containing protein [Cyanobacteria bacterium J06560_6]